MLTKPTLLEVQREVIKQASDGFDVEPATETVGGVVNDGFTYLHRIRAAHDVPVDDSWPRHETHAMAIQRARLKNGTEPLYDDVATLGDVDHPLTIASDDRHATIEHVLDVFSIDDRSGVAYGRGPTVEGAQVKKPDPRCTRRTMDELGVGSALYVGDSNVGVVAADCAGAGSAFIRQSRRDGYQLAVEPIYELNSLDKLLAAC